MFEVPKSDLAVALRHFGIDPARVEAGLTRALDRLKTGNSRPPALAPAVRTPLAPVCWAVRLLQLCLVYSLFLCSTS